MKAQWAVGGAMVAAAIALLLSALWRAADEPPRIAPGAVQAVTFSDLQGRSQTLGQFAGKIVVVNFWATWCAPCREEMPALVTLQRRWGDKGVQFVGLANEDPRRVERFGREIGADYPLWVGGDAVSEFSRRLGNHLGVLPYTVILDRSGAPVHTKVGAYTEAELDADLQRAVAKVD